MKVGVIMGVMGVALGVMGAEEGRFTVDRTEFCYRVPSKYDADSRIVVLFGGRNWPGSQTLKMFRFDELAERHRVFLLSPSFRDRDYWEPEKWSGPALKKAVAELEKRYRLKPQKLYLYGYSAGGQCAALFYAWMPERVAAWGAHGCGVYPEKIIHYSAPALISCGLQDGERFEISKNFLYRYRELGGSLLWKYYRGGHTLMPEPLALARAWFDGWLAGKPVTLSGEDDTFRIVPAGQAGRIDPEYRNPLFDAAMAELWRQ